MRPPPVPVSRWLMAWTPGPLWRRLPARLTGWVVDGWMAQFPSASRP